MSTMLLTNVIENAVAKLKGESVCDTRVPAQPILMYLVQRCEGGDEDLAEFIMQDIKTLAKCFNHVYEQVKAHLAEELEKAKNERMESYSAWIDDQEVYRFAVDYYVWSAKAEEEAEAESERKRIEAQEKAAKEKAEREEKTKQSKARADAKAKKAKSMAEKETPATLDSFMDEGTSNVSYMEPLEDDDIGTEDGTIDAEQTTQTLSQVSFRTKDKKKDYTGQMSLFDF